MTKLGKQQTSKPYLRVLIFGFVVLLAVTILVVDPFDLPNGLSTSAALILLVVGALATGLISEQITILIFFYLASFI